MKSLLKKHWPLFVSLLFFIVLTIFLYFIVIFLNDGNFVYAIDDTYIHMSISKNLANYNNWGINKDEFCSASSSILYSILISSLFRLIGPNELVPLWLNISFSIIAICVVYWILHQYILSDRSIFSILIMFILITPLIPLSFKGMETPIQIALTLLFSFFAVKGLSNESFQQKGISKNEKILLILAPFITMVRYEGLFLLFVVFFLFLLRKKIIFSLILGLVGALPIGIFALISMLNGFFPFPTSVILKSAPVLFNNIITIGFFIGDGILLYFFYFHVLKNKENWIQKKIVMIIFFSSLYLHLQFSVLSLYRHQAYLIGSAIIILGILSWKKFSAKSLKLSKIKSKFNDKPLKVATNPVSLKKKWAFLIILINMSSAYVVFQTYLTIHNTNNIYNQQYQMAHFLNTYYDNNVVMANDIGAINFYSEITCIDLWGLGSQETATARLNGNFTKEFLLYLGVKYNVSIAILFEDWFIVNGSSILPTEWIRVGTWQIPDNLACGSDTVTFYAIQDQELIFLRQYLEEFLPQLPEEVIQTLF